MKKSAIPGLIFICLLILSAFGSVFSQDSEEDAVSYAIAYDPETGTESTALLPEIEIPNVSVQDGMVADDSLKFDEDIEILQIKNEETAEDEIPAYKIFGYDGRQIIKYSPNNKPYTAVVRIISDQGRCSGFMIGQHYAATAAHCLYDPKDGWVKKMEVCPAASGNNTPYGCSDWSQVWIMSKYKYGDDKNYDVGLIELRSSIGNRSGWLGWSQISDAECFQYAQVLGYASDYDMNYMFSSEGYLDGTTYGGKRLKYKMDTLPGSSGGPVIVSINGKWDYVVGINAHHNDDTNFAVRFTREIRDFLGPYWGK